MRLFIAIPLSKTVKQKLLDLQQPIKGLCWQGPEQMHLTLKFVGEVNHQKATELREKLEEIDYPAFTISIEGVGYFPEGKHPKVVWAGVSENSLLAELHQEVEERCKEIGIPPENRLYRPHITLARAKNVSKRAVSSFINQHKKFSICDVPVNDFVLYQSKLHADGARHSRLQIFSLKNA